MIDQLSTFLWKGGLKRGGGGMGWALNQHDHALFFSFFFSSFFWFPIGSEAVSDAEKYKAGCGTMTIAEEIFEDE